MSSNEQPFGPWVEAMEKAGAVDPRNGRPSWTQLAARAEISVSAVTNMVNGKTKAKPGTVQKVASALSVRPEVVSGWLGQPRPVRGPYVPVAESSLLTPHERDALDLLIRAIARGRAEESDGDGNATTNTPAGVNPAKGLIEAESVDLGDEGDRGTPGPGPDTRARSRGRG